MYCLFLLVQLLYVFFIYPAGLDDDGDGGQHALYCVCHIFINQMHVVVLVQYIVNIRKLGHEILISQTLFFQVNNIAYMQYIAKYR